jgi:hypothetical protein
MPARPPLWRSALVSVLVGLAVAGLGTVPGMGLPGAFAHIPAIPLISWIWGVSDAAMFPRDSAWPYMIMLTWCLGPLIPLAWLSTSALSGWRRALAVGAILVVGGTGAALGPYAWGIAPLLPTDP